MKRLLTALLLLAGTAQAQDTGCAAQVARLGGLLSAMNLIDGGIAADEITSEEGWCHARNVVLDDGDRYLTQIMSRLSWQGEGLDRFAATGLPPQSLAVRVRKAGVEPKIDDPGFTYAMAAQRRRNGADVDLDIHWDPDDRKLVLDRLEIRFPGNNRIAVSGRATGVDLTDRAAIEMSAGSVGLAELNATLVTHGLFETVALPTLAPIFLQGGDDPEQQVAELKAEARTLIGMVPDAVYRGESADALLRFIDSLPHPNGTLSVTFTADPPIGPARYLELALAGFADTETLIAALMEGLRYEITYDHVPFVP